jgi:hypothetical protein
LTIKKGFDVNIAKVGRFLLNSNKSGSGVSIRAMG